ncbi:MAG: putative iron-sulfur cluster-binding metallochaperone [Thiotrichales bacterium]
MSSCCSNSCDTPAPPKKHICPVNGKLYKAVSLKTVLHQVKEPWMLTNPDLPYYYCDDPECTVFYFSADNSVITREAMRVLKGQGEHEKNSLLCYCFNIDFEMAASNPELKRFVIDRTRDGLCACDARNPSGQCCLKHFPKD